MELPPWYKVVTPRKDLREGKPIDASEFAIHLDQVVEGRAPEDYQNPERFFEKTYLTEGLLELSAEVLRCLSGEVVGASPVINLTTPFGGGKTHALTLLYHLAKSGEKALSYQGVDKILKKAELKTVPEIKVAVFVGNKFDVFSGHGAPNEPTRMTPWGDIAWQLGGYEAYKIVEEHDKKRVAPSQDVIRKFLPKDKPVLILMDEVLNFMSRARSIKAGETKESTLASQFYSFLENLTREATSPDRRICLVLSLPMSEQEMTPEDEIDFGRLKKLSGRVDKPYTLAKDIEMAEIIRRRFFEDLGDRETIRKVAKAYADWLKTYRKSIPLWFPVDNAEKLFEATYPFHPTLLSVFERKWQTLPKFQQTRGVLRMFALWISRAYAESYTSAYKDPLITLGTAPFEDDFFRAAVLEQLDEPDLDRVIKVDIAGEDAHATKLDAEAVETLKEMRLCRKVASVIFFESSGGQIREGATIPEIRLSVGEPGVDIGNIETSLENLISACYYLDTDGNRYWFSIRPTLNKLLADRRATISDEKIKERIEEEIKKVFSKGPQIERIFFPEQSNQIPDRATLTLVISSIDHSWDEGVRPDTLRFIDSLTQNYGTSARIFKSALIWVIPERVRSMKDEARTLLAWEAIEEEADRLNLSDTQRKYLKEQLKRSERNLYEGVWRCYKNVLLLGKDNKLEYVDLGLLHSSASDQREGLTGLILSRLKQLDYLTDKVSPGFIARNWPPAISEWETISLRDMFFSSPQFPRLTDAEKLRQSIAEGVSKGMFGYAQKTAEGKYIEVRFHEPMNYNEVELSEGVVLLPKQLAEALKRGVSEPEKEIIPLSETSQPPQKHAEKPPEKIPPLTYSTIRWEGDVPHQKWMIFYTRVLSKFSTEKLKLHVKIEVESESGISKEKINETKASLHELGLNDEIKTVESEKEKNK